MTHSYQLIEALPIIPAIIGGIASIAGGLLAPKPKAPNVPGVPPAPPPASQPQGSQTSSQPESTPSFLAAATTPQQGQTIGGGTGKTLLGQ
jgi:hypothetical protein